MGGLQTCQFLVHYLWELSSKRQMFSWSPFFIISGPSPNLQRLELSISSLKMGSLHKITRDIKTGDKSGWLIIAVFKKIGHGSILGSHTKICVENGLYDFHVVSLQRMHVFGEKIIYSWSVNHSSGVQKKNWAIWVLQWEVTKMSPKMVCSDNISYVARQRGCISTK
jgi:hypothetical protein